MASGKTARVALKAGERKIIETSEALAEAISQHLTQLGATGIVQPKPPRPRMEIVGRLIYGLMLILQANDLLRRSRK